MAPDSGPAVSAAELDAAACDGLGLVGIRKSFAGKVALDGVTFCVPRHAIVAVLGPSGSGKSTLLSIIAGLEAPTTATCCGKAAPSMLSRRTGAASG